MTRDLAQLAGGPFDVLVIGGGIHGLATAYEAAQRGLRAALVERRDFGSGASFNHHKTLHGGLRYLQTADIRRMRESIRERRAFARIAPHLISPQPFVMPTSSRLARSTAAMRAAFLAHRALGYDRNDGVPASHALPPGRVLSRDEFLALVPQAADLPATGAALWYDYRTDEGERLTLAFGLAASRHGAVLANYVDATEPIRNGNRVTGMKVRDAVSGDALDVRAAVTVNAAGAAAARLMAAFGARKVVPLLKAMNIVTSREARGPAVALPSAEGRLLVALPWRGRLTVGTSHGAQLSGPDDTWVRAGEVLGFLREVNSAFPWLSLGLEDVSLVHRGVVPAKVRPGHAPALLDRVEIRDHAVDGLEGAVSVVGVKYTTARLVAQRTIDLVARKLGHAIGPSRTSELPLLLAGSDGAGEGQSSDTSAAAARVLGAVRDEMAITLEDVVVRRTSIGAAGYPGDAVVRACADVVRAELGWSPERTDDEIAAVRLFYEIGQEGERDGPLAS